MARLAKVYQCMGTKLRMRLLMNIGLGMEFMKKKTRVLVPSWHIFIDYEMVNIPINFVATADTPGIPTMVIGIFA